MTQVLRGKPRHYAENIEYVHGILHRGIYFIATRLFSNVANDGFAYMRISTNGDQLHGLLSVDAMGMSEMTVYKESTVSDGTEIALAHLNDARNRSAELTVKFYYSPTVTEGNRGNIWLPTQLIPGGLGPQSVSGSYRAGEEMILVEGGTYLVAVQNKSGQSKNIQISAGFYPSHI